MEGEGRFQVPLLARYGLVLIGGIVLSNCAFSRNVRNKIWQRAGGKSELSGLSEADGYSLECAHLNHSRDYPRYNDPSNGRLLTTEEHLADHLHRTDNGLDESGNTWAVRKLRERLGS